MTGATTNGAKPLSRLRRASRFRSRAAGGMLLLATLTVPGIAGGVALYTIGADDPGSLFPVPRALTPLSTAGTVGAGTNLGDGSIGFNGGLAFRPGATPVDDLLFTVGNDSSLASSLYSVGTDGAGLTPVLGLGSGFTGGLAWHGAEQAFYTIASDLFGASALYRIPTAGGISGVDFVGDLGFGFIGGLTFNEDNGKLYAISTDLLGVPRVLSAITLGPTLSVDTVFTFAGSGFAVNGGLAYEASSDLFYAIRNDSGFNSTLGTFTLASAGAFDVIGGLGFGFGNRGLTLGPDVVITPVAEPSTLSMMITMLVLLLLATADRARRTARPATRLA